MNVAENTKLFFDTAKERYQIKLRKDIGHAPFWNRGSNVVAPAWTADAVFQDYRFCNVFREDDKVTKWFRMNIRACMTMPQQHVRAAVLFRWFNLPATGELMRPYLMGKESMEEAECKIHARAEAGLPILNAAYMIKSPPGMRKTKGIFQCFRAVEADIWELARKGTLQETVEALCAYDYIGPFMAYQAVCDLRFTDVLCYAPDINTWTSPGPGSARGISRVFFGQTNEFNYNSAVDKAKLISHMQTLLGLSRLPENWPVEWPKWELSTVQHWACEFDKYCRVLNGEGEPKQRYRFRDTIAG